MINRIRGLCKAVFYKLCKGKAIHFGGVPRFESRARINLKKGSVRIGKGLSLKPNAYCAIVSGGRLTIGNAVSIARNCTIVCHDSISIGDGCAIAANVAIFDHDHKFGVDGIRPGYNTSPIVIERNVWLGAGVIVLRGAHIGEGSVIGAGCVVKGDVPAHSLVASGRELSVVPIVDRE